MKCDNATRYILILASFCIHRVGFGGKLVHKMRKASSNLIPSANRSSNNPASISGSNGSAATALPLPSTIGPNSSSMRSARDSVGGTHDSGLASTGDLHHDDSSSVGSGSLDSGQNSPAIEVGCFFERKKFVRTLSRQIFRAYLVNPEVIFFCRCLGPILVHASCQTAPHCKAPVNSIRSFTLLWPSRTLPTGRGFPLLTTPMATTRTMTP